MQGLKKRCTIQHNSTKRHYVALSRVKNLQTNSSSGVFMTATITLPVPVVRDLSRKLVELEEILETIEILSDKQLMAGIEKGQKDIQEGRSKKINSVKDLDSLG